MSDKKKNYKRLSEVSEEQKKELLNILKSGFDPAIISNEFNILQSDLEEYLRKSQVATISSQNQTYNKFEQSRGRKRFDDARKMEIIREKYRKIYGVKEVKTQKITEPNLQDIEKASKILEKAKQDMSSLEGKSNFEKREGAIKILKELREVCDLQCTTDQLYEALQIAFDESFGTVSTLVRKERAKNEENFIKKTRSDIFKKMKEQLQEEADRTESLEELLELKKKIPYMMKQGNMAMYGDTMAIDSKISRLRLKRALEDLQFKVSANVQSIVDGIVSGNIDIEDAKLKIEDEVKSKLEKNPRSDHNTAFRQVFIQIRSILSKRADEFVIQDPHKAIEQLTELSGSEEAYMNLRAVAENFVGRGKTTAAKVICSKYRGQKEQERLKCADLSTYAHSLEKEIICSEIGSVILKQINANATREEDSEFINTLEYKIKESGVKKRAIKLGTNVAGTRNITLEDIWYDERQK